MDLRSSKAKLFLIELVIIILFFSFASGVCMKMFATAKQISMRSTELTMASMAAQSAAEAVKSGGEQGLQDALGVQGSDGLYEVHYDKDWNVVQGDGSFLMAVRLNHADNDLLSAVIEVRYQDDVLYQITAKRFEGGLAHAQQ